MDKMMYVLLKLIDFLKKPNICRHGINEVEEYCPRCFGYRKGAIMPSSAEWNGKERPKPAPRKNNG